MNLNNTTELTTFTQWTQPDNETYTFYTPARITAISVIFIVFFSIVFTIFFFSLKKKLLLRKYNKQLNDLNSCLDNEEETELDILIEEDNLNTIDKNLEIRLTD